MASSRDMHQTSRPLSHRSPPSSFNPLNATSGLRQPHSRTNSHTIMTPRPLAHEHRVRRKSLVNNSANMAAVAAAVSRADVDKIPALPMTIGPRRASKSGGLRPAPGDLTNMPAASVPVSNFSGLRGGADPRDDAVDDQEDMLPGDSDTLQTARNRRASDGQPLTKQGRKFNRPTITCPFPGCNKEYKHNSCLEKHRWEHTEAWGYTSRLLISKHQQVQILEAAKLLVGMNAQPTTPPESTFEPSSPSLSGGFSEQADGQSSARTTPPPQTDEYSDMQMDEMNFSMASDDEDDGRGTLSRQFRNDNANASSNFRRYLEPSPTPAPTLGESDDQLARAVAMLSCSYNSNVGSLTGQLPHDIPPVPAVPGRFLDQASLGQSPFLNSFPSQAPESFTRGQAFNVPESFTRGQAFNAPESYTRGQPIHRNEKDLDVDSRMEDDDDDARSRSRSDEEECGFFGRMED